MLFFSMVASRSGFGCPVSVSESVRSERTWIQICVRATMSQAWHHAGLRSKLTIWARLREQTMIVVHSLLPSMYLTRVGEK